MEEISLFCCFFFTNCSALLISSNVTPWVERRVSLTLFACAFLCVSLSSSRTGGTNDLQTEIYIILIICINPYNVSYFYLTENKKSIKYYDKYNLQATFKNITQNNYVFILT